MSIVSESLEFGTSDCRQGVSNMVLVKQDNGTFILGTSTVDGEQFFSLEPGQIPAGTYDIETANPIEYTNLVLEESAIELIGQPSNEQNVKDDDDETKERIINLIEDMKSNFTRGFNHVSKRIGKVTKQCNNLGETIDSIIKEVKDNGFSSRVGVAMPFGEKKSSSLVVGVDSSNFAINDLDDKQNDKFQVQPSKLLDIQAYPSGSWLGDPKNEDKRIRCPIKEIVLKQLNTTCTTPEKMALSLLDYLFDRETLANSNISGTSKHGKKQLDPIKIYGIRCHLEHLFQITSKDWHRIKQNIDSKCRASFRRKVKGMPLKAKTNMQISKTDEDGEALKFILTKPKVKEISIYGDGTSNKPKSVDDVFAAKNIKQEIFQYTTKNMVPISIHTADGLTFSLPAETVEQNSQIIQVQSEGNYEIIHSAIGEFSQFQLENAQILEQFESQVEQEVIIGT